MRHHHTFLFMPREYVCFALCPSKRERESQQPTCTDGKIKVCMWLREISSCSCLTVLPGPAWLLINKICIPLFRALYTRNHFCCRRILSHITTHMEKRSPAWHSRHFSCSINHCDMGKKSSQFPAEMRPVMGMRRKNA